MRILHSSDWHIGRQLNGYSLLDDQAYFLNWLFYVLKDEKIDILIIAGDIYNNGAPSAAAVSLLDEFFTKVIIEQKIKIILISGNHDSPEKLGFSSKLLEKSGLIVAGGLRGMRQLKFEKIGISLLPYFDFAMVKEIFKLSNNSSFDDASSIVANRIFGLCDCAINILVAHGLYLDFGLDCLSYCDSDIAVGGSDSLNLRKFKNFDYFALGHLHSPQKAGLKGLYSGSPLKYSTSEANQKKQVIVISADETNGLNFSSIFVEAARDLKILQGRFCDLLKIKSDDYISIRLTDEKFIIDPLGRLKVNCPNILDLSYLNLNFVEFLKNKELEGKNPKELFAKFYEEIVGEKMDFKEQKFLDKVIGEMEVEVS